MPFALDVLMHRQNLYPCLRSESAVRLRVLQPVGPETMVITHQNDPDIVFLLEPPHELRRGERLNFLERQHNHLAILLQQRFALRRRGQQLRDKIRLQHRPGVLFERNDQRLQLPLVGYPAQLLKEILVPAMDTVKEPYGRYPAHSSL